MHRLLILTVLFVGGCGKSIENAAETSIVTSSHSNGESQHVVDAVAAKSESVVGTYEQILGEDTATDSTLVLKPDGVALWFGEGVLCFEKRWSISDVGEVVVGGDRYKLTSNGDLVCRDRVWGTIELKRVNDINPPSEIK